MAKDLRITREQILKIEAAARREADIEFGLNMNHHRVHKSKKTYSRKGKNKKIEY